MAATVIGHGHSLFSPGNSQRPAGDPGAKQEFSTLELVAVTDISHYHCLFGRRVPGSPPVIMAPN